MKVIASGVKVIVANSIVWWLLMIVDDRWWSLMGMLGMIQVNWVKQVKVTDETIYQNHLLPKCSTEGTSLPTKGSWCVSLNGPVVSSSSPAAEVPVPQCWSKVQCAGTDLFADPSLLLAVLLRFDSPPCLSARGGPRRFVRNDRPVSWGRSKRVMPPSFEWIYKPYSYSLTSIKFTVCTHTHIYIYRYSINMYKP